MEEGRTAMVADALGKSHTSPCHVSPASADLPPVHRAAAVRALVGPGVKRITVPSSPDAFRVRGSLSCLGEAHRIAL